MIYQQLMVPLQNLEMKGIKNYVVMLENSNMVERWERSKLVLILHEVFFPLCFQNKDAGNSLKKHTFSETLYIQNSDPLSASD